MENMRSQIARTAFVNSQIIGLASETPEFQTCMRQVLKNCEGVTAEFLASYRVNGSAAHYVSLLYCLIVVPQQLYVWPENHDFYGHQQLKDAVGLFKVRWDGGESGKESAKFEQNRVFYLFRRLRNSVAHANFIISAQSQTFEFRDRKSEKTPDDFFATVFADDLGKFLAVVGHLVTIYELKEENRQ